MKEISVQIQYFASLREQRGLQSENVTTAASTSEGLYQQLCQQHGFSLPASRVKYAIDDAYVDGGFILADGMTLTFIPPVSGG